MTPRTPAGDDDQGATGGTLTAGHLLTRREAEMLPLLQQGRSNAQIAVVLQVGVETVRTHARNIYRKLGVSSRRELATPPAFEPVPARETASPQQEPGSSPRSPRPRATTSLTRPRRGHGARHR